MKVHVSLIAIFLLAPVLLFAHGSHGSGFLAGFTHPIFGLDHCFAIVGVGFLGAISNKKWYLFLLAFLFPMIIGGLIGVDNEATSLIESIIAISVILIGFFISFYSKNLNYAMLAGIAIFGFFHGFAHGAEMPESTTVFKYISGYLLGTILLMGIGYWALRSLFPFKISDTLIKVIGGFLMGAGVMFLIG